jgi:hypothetical protein
MKQPTLISNNPIEIVKWGWRLVRGLIPLNSYTVENLPDPADLVDVPVIVTNETGGRTIATSDGSNWKRVKDGATVS